ncbi:MAG: response regulator transcription factor [Opitutales bacterium]
MSKRLLVIEDNPELLELVSMIISAREGYDVIQVKDGREAMALVEKDSFDIVITDLVLATLPGVEIIRKLRELQSNVRIIAISGKGQGYLDDALEAGADVAMPKPFTIAQMVAALEPGQEVSGQA